MSTIADFGDEQVTVRLPQGATLAVERAAILAHVRPSEMVRRLIIDGLEARGFELPNSDRVE